MISYTIAENRLEVAIRIMQEVPEFDDLPTLEEIQSRISPVPHLMLTAQINRTPVGFKIGYERDGRFYSWLGGVLAPCRQMGIATGLADKEEECARNHGYTSMWMKTRNRFPEMLLMALRRGFRIREIDPRDKIGEHRIVLTKSL